MPARERDHAGDVRTASAPAPSQPHHARPAVLLNVICLASRPRRLPAVELAAVALGEVVEVAAEAGDVVAVDAQVAGGADRPRLLLAGRLEADDLVAGLLELGAGGLRLLLAREREVDADLAGLGEIGAVLLERLQDLQVVLVGRPALGEDLELGFVVGHLRTLPYRGGPRESMPQRRRSCVWSAMSFLDELDELADEVKDDVQELRNRAVKLLEAHAREHPDRLFKLLRTVKPVLLRHNLAIVTRYHDVEEVLTHDEAFSVQPYREKMVRLAGDFILGTDDSPRTSATSRSCGWRRRAPTCRRWPASSRRRPRRSWPRPGGRIDVADLSKRVPARLFARWFGTPGPDEDTLMAWTLAIFEEIFVNVKNDPAIAAEARSRRRRSRPTSTRRSRPARRGRTARRRPTWSAGCWPCRGPRRPRSPTRRSAST